MSTTPHPFTPEEIMAHLDGELSPARAQSLAAHIEGCGDCQALVTSLRNTSRSLTNWTVPAVDINAKFEDHLSASAFNRSSKLSGSGGLKLRIILSQRWKTLAASSVLVVVLIMLFGLRAGRYDMSKHSSRLAAAQRVDDQETMESLQQQELTSHVDLASSAPMPNEEKGLASPTDRFTRAEVSKQPSQEAIREFNRLQLYAKVQRAIEPQKAEPMIARTVSLSLIAKDFDSSRASLDAIVIRHNGYSANLAVNTPQGAARTLQASLRIPAPQLPAALAEIKALGRAEAENQNGEEVTQQHADLVARLKNSRETEQRLQAILTQRTGKISDVLEVEQEIARVRGEIEQMEAEQKNLEHRVDFATIDLKLSEEYKAKLDSPAPAISTLIHNAAVNGYRNVADTLLSIVLFFAEYGPVLCFWLLLFFIPAWLVWRRWRQATAAI
jgi:anti-sigma factor RsiW